MRPELAWLSGTLALEHAYAARLERLLQALHRLSGATFPAQAVAMPTAGASAGGRTAGAARAAAAAPPTAARRRHRSAARSRSARPRRARCSNAS
ncbi:hypothetical protein GCM10020295_45230 [Streptomyces cinereospinus]